MTRTAQLCTDFDQLTRAEVRLVVERAALKAQVAAAQNRITQLDAEISSVAYKATTALRQYREALMQEANDETRTTR